MARPTQNRPSLRYVHLPLAEAVLAVPALPCLSGPTLDLGTRMPGTDPLQAYLAQMDAHVAGPLLRLCRHLDTMPGILSPGDARTQPLLTRVADAIVGLVQAPWRMLAEVMTTVEDPDARLALMTVLLPCLRTNPALQSMVAHRVIWEDDVHLHSDRAAAALVRGEIPALACGDESLWRRARTDAEFGLLLDVLPMPLEEARHLVDVLADTPAGLTRFRQVLHKVEARNPGRSWALVRTAAQLDVMLALDPRPPVILALQEDTETDRQVSLSEMWYMAGLEPGRAVALLERARETGMENLWPARVFDWASVYRHTPQTRHVPENEQRLFFWDNGKRLWEKLMHLTVCRRFPHFRTGFAVTDEGRTEYLRAVLPLCGQLQDTDDNGWTALHHAACQQDEAFVALLVDVGVNAGLRTKEGLTALALRRTMQALIAEGHVNQNDLEDEDDDWNHEDSADATESAITVVLEKGEMQSRLEPASGHTLVRRI